MRNRPIPGEDRTYSLGVDFLDAVFGTTTDIEIDHLEDCGTCEGSGVKAGTTPSTCSTCGGQGQVMSAMRTPLGVFQQVTRRAP